MFRTKQKLVGQVAEAFASDPAIDEDAISAKLCSEGYSLGDAERAIAFVPIAFGRQYLSADPPTYQPGFEIRDMDTGRSKSGVLADEALYRAAEKEAAAWQTARRPAFLRVVACSAEIHVVAQLAQRGSQVSHLVLVEPVFTRIPIELQ